jgi:hypothetical protein
VPTSGNTAGQLWPYTMQLWPYTIKGTQDAEVYAVVQPLRAKTLRRLRHQIQPTMWRALIVSFTIDAIWKRNIKIVPQINLCYFDNHWQCA